MTFNPAEKRDAHGRWTAGPRLSAVLKGHNVKGLGTNPGTAEKPVNVKGDVMLAAKLIGQGKHVRLNKVDQVGTLLRDLLVLTKDAKKRDGRFDLCRVSLPKTNLFCAKNKGIDRIDMPQLAGVPHPGSKAAALRARTTANHPGGEVDLTAEFEQTLRAHGVKVTDTTVPAASLKATQDQLVGSKVAGLEKFMKTAPKDSPVFEPIFITRDHYIIDGHHRWAAMVGLDAEDGVLGNFPMKVRMADMDIGEALAAAKAFSEDWGIASEGTQHTGPTVAKFATKSLSSSHGVNLDLAFDPSEARDSHGRWTSIGGNALSKITQHLRGLPAGSTVATDKESFQKASDGTFAPFEPGSSLTSETLGRKINVSGVGHTKTPPGYDARQDLLDSATRHDVPRMSALANAHDDLLDDPLVRKTLSSTIGGHRLVTSHDYRNSRTPEEKAKANAALDEMMAARAKGQERQQALEQLNTMVSDFEFNTMFGLADDGQDIKDLLRDHPELMDDPHGKALLKDHPELTGRPPSYEEASKDYQWPDADKQGGFPGDKGSMEQEHRAQIKAEFWHDTMGSDASPADLKAKEVWEAYQAPTAYGAINGELRSGVEPEAGTVDYDPGPPELLQMAVARMFKEAGEDAPHKMTLYRAIRSSDVPGHNWAENFKVGSTFTDKGIMSCTAHGKFAQGWLNNDPVGQEEDAAKENDVVLEIRVPKGQRIMGGTKQFIETMLPPNTPLKIISNEKRRAEDARNPLNGNGDFAEDPFYYTHVVAEVQP